MLTLVRRTIARVVGLSSALALVLVSFEITLVAVAATFEIGRSFEHLAVLSPAFMQNTLGPALTSFSGLTSLGFYEPLIVMLVVQFAIYLATEPAGDVESGLVDLLLARAMPRHRLITRSLLVTTGAAVALPLLMAVSLWLSLWLFAPPDARWPEAKTVVLLMVHLVAVTWCFGGAGLAAGAGSRRRGAAQSAVGVSAMALYLMDFIGDASARASWLAYLSPFHAFHGAHILAGTGHPARNLTVLATLGAIGVAIAYWRFQRRDV